MGYDEYRRKKQSAQNVALTIDTVTYRKQESDENENRPNAENGALLHAALPTTSLRASDIFSGIGGLALGVHQSGFQTVGLLEHCSRACALLERNLPLLSTERSVPSIVNADIRTVSNSPILAGLDLLTGGPPCQPFSRGGIKKGQADQRNLFPEAIRLIRATAPRSFLFENVKGLMTSANLPYLEYVELQLKFPSILQGRRTWESHYALLQRYSIKCGSPTYEVHRFVANAANYGSAQKRERIFLVGFNSSNSAEWAAPQATHCPEMLAYAKWKTGHYWLEHQLRPQKPNSIEKLELDRSLRMLEKRPEYYKLQRWRTVRDVLNGLPELPNRKLMSALNHSPMPGARSYEGHTGSEPDRPSKAIKAGNHGVAGGENMMRNADGSVRYFTMRELARIQSFPDNFELVGNKSTLTRQLGNAVPVCLARQIGTACFKALRQV